jgi:hypothetical protein
VPQRFNVFIDQQEEYSLRGMAAWIRTAFVEPFEPAQLGAWVAAKQLYNS